MLKLMEEYDDMCSCELCLGYASLYGSNFSVCRIKLIMIQQSFSLFFFPKIIADAIKLHKISPLSTYEEKWFIAGVLPLVGTWSWVRTNIF